MGVAWGGCEYNSLKFLPKMLEFLSKKSIFNKTIQCIWITFKFYSEFFNQSHKNIIKKLTPCLQISWYALVLNFKFSYSKT